MLHLALRSFFFIVIILGYSTGIWRLINDYFRHEFQTFLEQESKANRYILQDPPAVTVGSKQAGKQLLHADAPQRSPLLDEVILNVGQTLTDRGGREGGKATPEGDHQKVTNSISEFSNPIVESSSSSSSSSTVTQNEGTPPRRNPPASVEGWQKGGVSLPASELQTGPGSGQKMVAVSHDGSSREKAAIEMAAGPVIAAEAAAEVTDIRPTPGARKQYELRGEESEEDKWISYWQEPRQERKDIDASASAFCSIGAQPSDENPSGALRPQGEAVAAGGEQPSACGSGGK
uniref:Uncharacterized protein n=1 Tax=Anopheles atroparvus TaxID=41427 RepID=A0AAG5DW40_ANOAO